MKGWGTRIVGLLILLVLLFLLMYMQKQLTEIARERGVTTTTR